MQYFKPTYPSMLDRSHALTRGLIGLWMINESAGRYVYDLAKGNTGDLGTSNMPAWFGHGNGLEFANDFVTIADSATFYRPAQVSVTAVVHFNSNTNAQFIFGKEFNGHNDPYLSWELYKNAPGAMFYFQPSGSGLESVSGSWPDTGTNTPTMSRIYIMTGVYDPVGSRAEIWVDGRRVGSSNAHSAAIAYDSNDILIGENAKGGDSFDGGFYFGAIHSRALSDIEIRQLHYDPFALVRNAVALQSYTQSFRLSVANILCTTHVGEPAVLDHLPDYLDDVVYPYLTTKTTKRTLTSKTRAREIRPT